MSQITGRLRIRQQTVVMFVSWPTHTQNHKSAIYPTLFPYIRDEFCSSQIRGFQPVHNLATAGNLSMLNAQCSMLNSNALGCNPSPHVQAKNPVSHRAGSQLIIEIKYLSIILFSKQLPISQNPQQVLYIRKIGKNQNPQTFGNFCSDVYA